MLRSGILPMKRRTCATALSLCLTPGTLQRYGSGATPIGDSTDRPLMPAVRAPAKSRCGDSADRIPQRLNTGIGEDMSDFARQAGFRHKAASLISAIGDSADTPDRGRPSRSKFYPHADRGFCREGWGVWRCPSTEIRHFSVVILGILPNKLIVASSNIFLIASSAESPATRWTISSKHGS